MRVPSARTHRLTAHERNRDIIGGRDDDVDQLPSTNQVWHAMRSRVRPVDPPA